MKEPIGTKRTGESDPLTATPPADRTVQPNFRSAKCSTAVVAGGALLSAMVPCEGAIVYQSMDATLSINNTTIFFNGPSMMGFNFFAATTNGTAIRNSMFFGALPNGVLGSTSGGHPLAANLASGAAISAGAGAFGNTGYFGIYTTTNSVRRGNFSNGNTGYVGIRFDLGGGNYKYGWVHIDSYAADNQSLHVSGWAYENDVNTSINAGDGGGGGGGAVPEPSGLALLACGAAGVLALRKKARTDKAE